MRLVLVALSAMVATSACRAEAHRADVPGTYVMNRGRAADTLWLMPQGHYTHLYRYPADAPIVRGGCWTWSRFENTPLVELDDFIMLSRRETFPSALRQQGGIWPAQIERSLLTGRVRLPVDDDVGWAYERVSPGLLGSGGGAAERCAAADVRPGT